MAKSRKQVQAVPAEDTESPVKSTVEMVPDAPTTVPAQDNVVTLSGLVSQSLKSGDAGLLETALGVTDQTVIEATLERIPAEQSTVLLKALLQRIEAKPSRLVHLMPWIRSTLVVHASFISTNGEAKEVLERVKMMLEDRTKSRDQLLKLSGRLEMLMMQVVRRTRNMDPSNLDAGKVNALVSTPMALYEDDVEDDAEPVDMDIVPPAADDEDEVEEDKDKSDDEEAMEESDDDEEAQE